MQTSFRDIQTHPRDTPIKPPSRGFALALAASALAPAISISSNIQAAPDAGQTELDDYRQRLYQAKVEIDRKKLENAMEIMRRYIREVSELHAYERDTTAHRMLVDGNFQLPNRTAAEDLIQNGAVFVSNVPNKIHMDEPHPFKYLAALALSGVSLDAEFNIQGRRMSVRQIIINMMANEIEVSDGAKEVGWFLLAVGSYFSGPIDAHPRIMQRIEDALKSPAGQHRESCFGTHLTAGLIVATTHFKGADRYLPKVRERMRSHLDAVTMKLYEEQAGLQPTDYLYLLGHVIEVYGYAATHGMELSEEEKNMLSYAVNSITDTIVKSKNLLLKPNSLSSSGVVTVVSHTLHGVMMLREAGII